MLSISWHQTGHSFELGADRSRAATVIVKLAVGMFALIWQLLAASKSQLLHACLNHNTSVRALPCMSIARAKRWSGRAGREWDGVQRNKSNYPTRQK